MGTPNERIADELGKLMDIFFPPVSRYHNKKERKELAKSAAKFARAATSILAFIEGSKISETRKQQLTNDFYKACRNCQQHKDVRLGAIKRLETKIKKLPPPRRKFEPKIIKPDDK